MESLGFPPCACLPPHLYRSHVVVYMECVKLDESGRVYIYIWICWIRWYARRRFHRRSTSIYQRVFLVYIVSLSSSISMQIGKWLNSNEVLCIKFRRICQGSRVLCGGDGEGINILGWLYIYIYIWDSRKQDDDMLSHNLYITLTNANALRDERRKRCGFTRWAEAKTCCNLDRSILSF